MGKKYKYIEVVDPKYIGKKYHSKRMNTLITVSEGVVDILKADGKKEWLKKKRITNANITTKFV